MPVTVGGTLPAGSGREEVFVGVFKRRTTASGRKGRRGLWVGIVLLAALLGVTAWFVLEIFEGKAPEVVLEPRVEYLSEPQEFFLIVTDAERGIRRVEVSIRQEGREVLLYEESFPFRGLLNRAGVHRIERRLEVSPVEQNLVQGSADLQVRVWDFSRRRGGDGNLTVVDHRMIVDTIPPAIRAISRLNYVTQGGTGLVVYQTSSDCVESGVMVGELFFQGYPAPQKAEEGYHLCYFAIPIHEGRHPEVYLRAKDRAGNETKSHFYCYIRKKRFRKDRIQLSESFISQVLTHFPDYPFPQDKSDIEKFLLINRGMRAEDTAAFYELRNRTVPEQLWEGPWLRMRNAAPMAGFGDRRSYYFKGEKVDEQTHLGIDLASTANAKVPAANRGRVIFAGPQGIYGLTVVLDHGQGLFSSYSHLSQITVQLDQEVSKGEMVGITGQTGLAGGDHLHFGVLVGGIFVNPREWWDPHWIQDNIQRKLDLIRPM